MSLRGDAACGIRQALGIEHVVRCIHNVLREGTSRGESGARCDGCGGIFFRKSASLHEEFDGFGILRLELDLFTVSIVRVQIGVERGGEILQGAVETLPRGYTKGSPLPRVPNRQNAMAAAVLTMLKPGHRMDHPMRIPTLVERLSQPVIFIR